MIIVGKTCIVHAGKVEPSLPVAIDTTTIQKYSASGWARFNKGENLEMLERSLTPQLEQRAPRYLQLAADTGRQTIAEFVTQWLLREQKWARNPEYRVVVLYPGETHSANQAKPGVLEHQQ
jgi:hypothetical protein